MTGPLRIATRSSALARWQAGRVGHLLSAQHDHELVVVSTRGDRERDRPIHELSGTGVFVREVQAAVLDGRADLAVHSAKDLPAETPAGLVIACVPERADPRDAMIGARIADLGPGAVVGTGSVRRRVQLGAAVPGLEFVELRGNVETRVAKARDSDLDAVVLAHAGLLRLGLQAEIAELLEPDVMIPQVGQGALAVECRADDTETLAALAAIDDRRAHGCVEAERAFLAALGGGCDRPLGALATRADDGTLTLIAMLADDAGRVNRTRQTGPDTDPAAIGNAAARDLTGRPTR